MDSLYGRMVSFGGDLGLSDFIYQRLSRFRKKLPRTTRKRIADFVTHTILIFSVAGPIMTIPQVAKIYVEQAAGGLSLLTWSSYLFLSFFWLNYGLLIRNKPIVMANTFNIIINTLIITGIAIYN